MKNLNKNMDWREYEGKSNPIIPYEIVKYIHTILKTFTASEESPAMPARGKPMNPAGEADEGGGEETTQKEEASASAAKVISGAEAIKT